MRLKPQGNQVQRLYYVGRKGPRVSDEIETEIQVLWSSIQSEVARGRESRMRLKPLVNKSLVAALWGRKGPRVSDEIETQFLVNVHIR